MERLLQEEDGSFKNGVFLVRKHASKSAADNNGSATDSMVLSCNYNGNERRFRTLSLKFQMVNVGLLLCSCLASASARIAAPACDLTGRWVAESGKPLGESNLFQHHFSRRDQQQNVLVNGSLLPSHLHDERS